MSKAQTSQSERETVWITGQILNASYELWDFAKTGYFENERLSITLKGDGSFDKEIPLEGHQELYLYINNDAITLYVQAGDTVEINWDENDFDNTFEVKSPSITKNNDLQLNLKLYREFRKPFMALNKKLWNKRDTTRYVKYQWINKQLNEELTAIVNDNDFSPSSSRYDKFIYQTFFKYLSFLKEYDLLNTYEFILGKDLKLALEPSRAYQFLSMPKSFKRLNKQAFDLSPIYRKFLFSYIRFTKSINGFTLHRPSSNMKEQEDIAPFTPVWDSYYAGMRALKIYSIRDWFVTKLIFFSFRYNSFKESEEVLQDFLPKCKTLFYKDTLLSSYKYFEKLKPGSRAPDFTLQNEQGKEITLSDFRGKVVYIDFWGVGCGPCIVDIKNYVPKLHQKYQDREVAFVNICVDADEARWKKSLERYQLHGTNLIAEGWTKHPVCKSYNISGIPHYLIVDQNGNIIDNNAPRPQELIQNVPNDIDKALESNR
ncbi:TlpA family protein disulfide reductase [Splendidivirga corallicola]|uniref:TlpA family protein disulfide reductase n=1 Tax=Splendidivirga corallicola TaxID=3051826 RepID=UPI0032119B1D